MLQRMAGRGFGNNLYPYPHTSLLPLAPCQILTTVSSSDQWIVATKRGKWWNPWHFQTHFKERSDKKRKKQRKNKSRRLTGQSDLRARRPQLVKSDNEANSNSHLWEAMNWVLLNSLSALGRRVVFSALRNYGLFRSLTSVGLNGVRRQVLLAAHKSTNKYVELCWKTGK